MKVLQKGGLMLDKARLGRARQELRRRSTRDGYERSELVNHGAESRRPDRPAKGPEQSRNAFRSAQRLHHTFGAVLHPQSFPHTRARPGRVSIADTGRGTERAKLELRRYPRHAFKEMRRHTGMRRQQPGIPDAARARRAMGTRRSRQCGMDGRSAVRAAGKRRTGRSACATSFWKAPTAACRRKSRSRRVGSPMPAVSRGRGRWNPTFSSLTR